jgi:hypothetical protein
MTCGMKGFEDDFCQHWPDIGSILSEIFVRGCNGLWLAEANEYSN